MSEWIVILGFLVIALLYAAVGHGGASGYLALMALLGLAPAVIRPSALVLNVIVSLIAAVYFVRSGYFRPRLFIPLAIVSIPMAWLGAHLQVSDHWYRILLAACLLIAVVRLLAEMHANSDQPVRPVSIPLLLIAGAGIGVLSGMIGIGGGILLSPFLLLVRWTDMRETAALSAPFILVNSLAALAALSSQDPVFPDTLLFWILATIAGGTVGAYLGSRRLPVVSLKYILAAVLLLATGKLILV